MLFALQLILKIVLSILGCELIRRLFNFIYYNKILNEPSGPLGLPIIGSLIPIIKNPASFFIDTATKYGPIMKINMGLAPKIVVNDPNLYKKLGAENKNIFVDKPHFNYLDIMLKELSIDAINGEQWVLRRKLLSSSFLRLINSKFVSETVDYSMNNVYSKLDNNLNEIWFPRQDVKYIVFNVAFKALFGSTLPDNHPILAKFFKLNEQIINDGIGILMFFDVFCINFLPNWFVKKFMVASVDKKFKEIFELIENWMIEEGGFKIDKNNELIERITRNDDVNNYYIDTVIEYLKTKKNKKKRISYYSLILDFNTILMAAADTTAHSAEYGLCLLCKHQDIEEMIYNEIKNTLNKHKMDEFDIFIVNECNYLRAFIYETLRISNVVPLNPHFNDKDINLTYNEKSYFIAKNSSIFINTAYIHYNCDPFNRSFNLNLNNWIDSNNNKFKMNSNFILFGHGKRNCVGQAVAVRELYYFFAKIILKYKLNVNDKTEKDKLNKMKQAWNAVTILHPQIGINLTKRT